MIAQLNLLAVTVSGMAALGLSKGAIPVLARARRRGQDDVWRQALTILFWVPLAVATAAAIVGTLQARSISRWLLADETLAWFVVVALASVPVNVLVESSAAALQGDRDLTGLARINIRGAVVATLVVVAAVLGFGLEGGVVAVLATSIATLLVHIHRNSGSIGTALRRFTRPVPMVRRAVLQVGGAAFVAGLATTGADLLIRSTIVGRLGLEANGLYQPAAALSTYVATIMISAFASFLYPQLSSLVDEPDELVREQATGLRWALALAVPAIAAVLVLRGLYIRLLYTAEFDAAAPLILLQAPGDFLRTVQSVLMAALLPLGRVRAWASLVIGTAVIWIALVLALLPTLGLDAAPIAYTASWGASVLATAWVARDDLARFGRTTWTVVAVAVGFTATSWVVAADTSVATGMAWLVMGGAAWLWFVHRRGDVDDQVAELRSHVRRRLRRGS